MKRVKYEIGYDLFSLIPASVTLLVFGGTTVILKIKNNGMFIFTGLLSLAVIAIIAAFYIRTFSRRSLLTTKDFTIKTASAKQNIINFRISKRPGKAAVWRETVQISII